MLAINKEQVDEENDCCNIDDAKDVIINNQKLAHILLALVRTNDYHRQMMIIIMREPMKC